MANLSKTIDDELILENPFTPESMNTTQLQVEEDFV